MTEYFCKKIVFGHSLQCSSGQCIKSLYDLHQGDCKSNISRCKLKKKDFSLEPGRVTETFSSRMCLKLMVQFKQSYGTQVEGKSCYLANTRGLIYSKEANPNNEN